MREVQKWDQPIISDHYSSINGFIIHQHNKTIHYLLNVIQEPGFSNPKFTSTISEKNFLIKNIKKLDYSIFFKKKNSLFDVVNSDEGGRFFKNQSRNLICELKYFNKIKLQKNYIWASHNQLIELINKNLLTIEARNLFASFNIEKIK